MNLSNLSIKALELYEDLRDNVESREEDQSGSIWGTVYLPNAQKRRTKQQFAGLLNALKDSELYQPYVNYFGKIKI